MCKLYSQYATVWRRMRLPWRRVVPQYIEGSSPCPDGQAVAGWTTRRWQTSRPRRRRQPCHSRCHPSSRHQPNRIAHRQPTTDAICPKWAVQAAPGRLSAPPRRSRRPGRRQRSPPSPRRESHARRPLPDHPPRRPPPNGPPRRPPPNGRPRRLRRVAQPRRPRPGAQRRRLLPGDRPRRARDAAERSLHRAPASPGRFAYHSGIFS